MSTSRAVLAGSGRRAEAGDIRARLSVSSSDPLGTGTSTTLYWLPFGGTVQALYDGTSWRRYALSSSGLSIALSGATDMDGDDITSRVCDVFVDWNGGAPQLALKRWASDTARTTNLALVDGVSVLDGATDHLYLGTVYVNASDQVVDDGSIMTRYCWNYYHRQPFADYDEETTNSWTVSGTNGTWSGVNGSSAAPWRHLFVRGMAEDSMVASAEVTAIASAGPIYYICAVALDGTTPDRTQGTFGHSGPTDIKSAVGRCAVTPGIGRRYLQAVETSSNSGGTQPTAWGDNGAAIGGGNIGIQSGMHVSGRR